MSIIKDFLSKYDIYDDDMEKIIKDSNIFNYINNYRLQELFDYILEKDISVDIAEYLYVYHNVRFNYRYHLKNNNLKERLASKENSDSIIPISSNTSNNTNLRFEINENNKSVIAIAKLVKFSKLSNNRYYFVKKYQYYFK